MSKLLDLIKEKRIYLDGGTGTVLQCMGIQPGESPERWNIEHPERITELHKKYFEAGSNVVFTNTFGINREKFEDYRELIKAGIDCARAAAEDRDDRFVAFDMGPLGKMLEPLGNLPFEEAVSIFADNVKAAAEFGADLIVIETMNDAYETKAAVLAAKENCDLPVFVTNAYDGSGRLMTGATPQAMIAMLEGLGVDALGMNCSFGPDKMLEIIGEFREYASVPVIVKPNAGMPEVVNGKTVFNINPDQFAEYMVELAQQGGMILGGCCGTTPEHVKKMTEATSGIEYKYPEKKDHTLISSYTHAVVIGDDPKLIGERINPTGKKKLKEALKNKDMDYILGEAVKQEEAGVQILDVNVGLPEIDEVEMMRDAVKEIQAVTALPLQIDTSDAEAMEAGMRIYNGKPLVNSVNGKEKVMEEIFPLVKKYGGTVIALTLGEEGIPETAEGRLEIALKIVEKAKEYGIDKKDIIVDPLAMTISSDQRSARVALEVVKQLKKIGIKTSMGVSNISFGLPKRDLINSTFFANALEQGMNCAIMNPFSASMMDVYHAFRALNGYDENCMEYIRYAEERPDTVQASGAKTAAGRKETGTGSSDDLKYCIIKGMKDKAVKAAETMLISEDPLDIINGYIVPALDEIGKDFEEKRAYLPQLLMSADAASGAFDVIKTKLPKSEEGAGRDVIMATVKGDIHDIGKNIVKVLLQSYGFKVIDLGKDVAPEAIRDCALERKCSLVGLSALMTTTVPAMEETIKAIRATGEDIKVMVGGAVLSAEYAEMIGADWYSPDGMDAVRYAERHYKGTEGTV